MNREQAIKELTELLPEEFLMEYTEAIRMGIEALSSAENPNKWIPVSERLPEIHQDVILSLRSLDIEVGFRAETEPYFYCHGADGCYIDPKNVLAWMQLPEPYQSEIPTGQIVANGELYPGEFDDPLAEEGSEEE